MQRFGRFSLAILLLSITLMASCANLPQEQPLAQEQIITPPPTIEQEAPPASTEPPGKPEAIQEPIPAIAPGPLLPNEAGQVMVLMYHRIGEPEAEWQRTPANFQLDLQNLYQQGYRLVSLTDYAAGKIDLPPGYSPVILTFDDGTQGQFNLIEKNGQLQEDPDSAVAILKQFAAAHPDFGQAATFYVFYPRPFGQADLIAEKFRRLQEYGMEIGNHSMGHQDLSRLSDADVQRVLAEHVERTRDLLPGYVVSSLALPYGAKPQNRALAVSGSWQSLVYQHEAVLLVGSNPAPSPYTTRFNPAAVPRIRASDPYLEQWLEHFRQHPEQRYVSDGDPLTVTVPAIASESIQESRLGSLSLTVR